MKSNNLPAHSFILPMPPGGIFLSRTFYAPENSAPRHSNHDTGNDIITISEFARNMGISVTTAHSWLVSGRLGEYVIKTGRVIRILWGKKLIKHLAVQSQTSLAIPATPLKRKGRGGHNALAFDINAIS